MIFAKDGDFEASPVGGIRRRAAQATLALPALGLVAAPTAGAAPITLGRPLPPAEAVPSRPFRPSGICCSSAAEEAPLLLRLGFGPEGPAVLRDDLGHCPPTTSTTSSSRWSFRASKSSGLVIGPGSFEGRAAATVSRARRRRKRCFRARSRRRFRCRRSRPRDSPEGILRPGSTVPPALRIPARRACSRPGW